MTQGLRGYAAGKGTHRPESSKLQLDPAWPASHRADHDVHVMPQLCHQLQDPGVRSFLVASTIQTISIVVISIFAPVTAIVDVMERACEFES